MEEGSARRERGKGHDTVDLDLEPAYELAARRDREREEPRDADDKVLAARRGLEAERDAVNSICNSMYDHEVGLERDLDGAPAQLPRHLQQAVIGPFNGLSERDVESADELAARRERDVESADELAARREREKPCDTDHKELAARREREAEIDSISLDSTGVLRGREERSNNAPLGVLECEVYGAPPQPPRHNQAGIVDRLNPHAKSFLPRVERNSADQPLVACSLNAHADIFMPHARVERHYGDRQLPLGECALRVHQRATVPIPDGDVARQVFDPDPQPQFSAVWRQNWEVESNSISYLLSRGRALIVSFDLEYAAPRPVNQQRGAPQNATDWYDRLHSLVNLGDLVQVGIAILLSEGENRLQIMELNMLFDQGQREYNPDTIEFLLKHKHNLEENRRRGIPSNLVSKWFKDEIGNLRAATWLMYQGEYDVGFLLRILIPGSPLPPQRNCFLANFRSLLPMYYDIRVLALDLVGFENGRGLSLDTLAARMGVARRIGSSHQAGSDALLTMDCYTMIGRLMREGMIQQRLGVLCGLYSADELVRTALSVDSPNMIIVDVGKRNFSSQSALLLGAIESNYRAIGVDVIFNEKLCHRAFDVSPDTCYRGLIGGLTSANVVEYAVLIALANMDGQIAGGQVWRFQLRRDGFHPNTSDGNELISVEDFSSMVLLAGLVSNRSITWICGHGAEAMLQIFGFLKPFPESEQSYLTERAVLFPLLYDIAYLVKNGGSRTLDGICGGFEINVRRNDGDPEPAPVLLLRCFLRIAATEDPSVLVKKSGLLLASSCCCRYSELPR